MILGLPFDAWLLLILAVGLGLTLELAFYRAHRRRGSSDAASGDPEDRDESGW